jgi:hypothetical protein
LHRSATFSELRLLFVGRGQRAARASHLLGVVQGVNIACLAPPVALR